MIKEQYQAMLFGDVYFYFFGFFGGFLFRKSTHEPST